MAENKPSNTIPGAGNTNLNFDPRYDAWYQRHIFVTGQPDFVNCVVTDAKDEHQLGKYIAETLAGDDDYVISALCRDGSRFRVCVTRTAPSAIGIWPTPIIAVIHVPWFQPATVDSRSRELRAWIEDFVRHVVDPQGGACRAGLVQKVHTFVEYEPLPREYVIGLARDPDTDDDLCVVQVPGERYVRLVNPARVAAAPEVK